MTRSIRTMPEAQKKALHRARWLEVIWIAVLGSIVAAIYFAVGSSQAMKTASLRPHCQKIHAHARPGEVV